jgi:hypothetical protein
MDKEKKSVDGILKELVGNFFCRRGIVSDIRNPEKETNELIAQAKHSLAEVLGDINNIKKVIRKNPYIQRLKVDDGSWYMKKAITDLAQAFSEWIKKEIND